ncbi:MAG: hypothetical protein ACJ8H8_10880, partial [Geminicoccaceae bacterium]
MLALSIPARPSCLAVPRSVAGPHATAGCAVPPRCRQRWQKLDRIDLASGNHARAVGTTVTILVEKISTAGEIEQEEWLWIENAGAPHLERNEVIRSIRAIGVVQALDGPA